MSHHYRMGKNTTYSTRRLNLCQLSNETHAASLTQKLQNKSTQQNVTHTAEITIAKYRQYDRFFTTWVTIKKLIKLQNFYSITLKNNHENSGSLPRVSEHPLCQSVFEQDTESLPTSDLPIEEEKGRIIAQWGPLECCIIPLWRALVTWGRLVIGHFTLKTTAIFFHPEQTSQWFLSPNSSSPVLRVSSDVPGSFQSWPDWHVVFHAIFDLHT